VFAVTEYPSREPSMQVYMYMMDEELRPATE
jgi:hypothetical protein